MKPLSTRIIKSDASYEEIMASVDTHTDLKHMKRTVLDEGVCFFIYRGGHDEALLMIRQEGSLYMKVCPCPKVLDLKTNPELLYAMCYGVE